MKLWKKIVLALLLLAAVCAAIVFGLNAYVVHSGEARILCRVETRETELSSEEVRELKEQNPECILILGAKVRADGSPSYMLQDRLDLGIKLYQEGVAPKLLLSGDHGQVQYDEVNAMKEYALQEGVPEEDLFLDHAGFSTYDSVYRAKKFFRWSGWWWSRRDITCTEPFTDVKRWVSKHGAPRQTRQSITDRPCGI